jgi:hypothetical protein
MAKLTLPEPAFIKELEHMRLPEPRWAINNLIPEGLTIMAGRPKVGKSWLALIWAITKSKPTRTFGFNPGKQGKVLYIGLEDSKRRLQKRIRKIMEYAEDPNFPDDLLYYIEFPRVDRGGIENLEALLQIHPDISVVIIDTLGKFKPVSNTKQIYDADVEYLSRLHRLAHTYHIALILIHHTRKAISDDWVDDISGTTGVAGTADTLMLLQKQSRGAINAILNCSGRDVTEREIALRSEDQVWFMIGDAAEVAKTQKRQEVINAVVTLGPASAQEIADHLQINRTTIAMRLSRMVEDGELVRNGNHYEIPDSLLY